MRIILLFGGKSAEHEVSIQSARNIAAALDPGTYEVLPVYVTREGAWHLLKPAALESTGAEYRDLDSAILDGSTLVVPAPREGVLALIDPGSCRTKCEAGFVYPVLHGPFGEDGTVQGMLKLFGIGFVGSGVLGSAAGMDKDVMRRLLREAGVPQPRFRVLHASQAEETGWEELTAALGPVLFVKPANMGSSVGVERVETGKELETALEQAFSYDRKVLVEQEITGREIECSVLQDGEVPVASLPGEVKPTAGFYSYSAKYLDAAGADLEVPAKLSGPQLRAVQELAVRAFRVLCAEGLARVDMFLPPDGVPMVNEINTLPGFTSISMYPKLWEVSGLSTGDLLDRLIGHALNRKQLDSQLKRK
jgi:D-alanine-D-alanine ligase